MAVIGIHRDHAVIPEIMLAIMRYTSFIQFIGWQDNDVAIYRIHADHLPQEDKMCTLNVMFLNGILPFVIGAEISEQIWQPSDT